MSGVQVFVQPITLNEESSSQPTLLVIMVMVVVTMINTHRSSRYTASSRILSKYPRLSDCQRSGSEEDHSPTSAFGRFLFSPLFTPCFALLIFRSLRRPRVVFLAQCLRALPLPLSPRGFKRQATTPPRARCRSSADGRSNRLNFFVPIQNQEYKNAIVPLIPWTREVGVRSIVAVDFKK